MVERRTLRRANEDRPRRSVRPFPPVERPSRSAETGELVTVACKLPNGLIMQLFEDIKVPQRDGSLQKERLRVGPRYVIAGNRHPYGRVPEPHFETFALTPHLPRALVMRWFEQNADADIVRNKLVFVIEKMETEK
jgi:hypothetical protein